MSKFAWLCAVLFLSPLPGQAPAEAVEEFKQSESLLSAGQIATFGDRLLAAGDASDVAHLVQVGNMLYRFDPPRALRLHEQALKLSPDHTDLRLELGYDYTAATLRPSTKEPTSTAPSSVPLALR